MVSMVTTVGSDSNDGDVVVPSGEASEINRVMREHYSAAQSDRRRNY